MRRPSSTRRPVRWWRFSKKRDRYPSDIKESGQSWPRVAHWRGSKSCCVYGQRLSLVVPAFRPSFSLEREGSEERRDLNWRGGGKEGVLPAIRDALLLNRTKKKRKRRVRWVSGENLWRIFMEMQILFSPMNALRKRKMHAKDGNLPFSDRDPFNSANKTSLLCNYVVSPEGSVTVSINLSLTFQPYLSSFRNGNCAIKVNEGINLIYMC